MTSHDRHKRLVDRYTVLATCGYGLAEFAASYQVNLADIAKPLGFEPEVFRDVTARISLDRFCRLLEALAQITGDETFGLRYGSYMREPSTSLYSIGLYHAPDLGTALDFIRKYAPVFSSVASFNISRDNNAVRIDWQYSPLVSNMDQYLDTQTSALVSLFNSFSSELLMPEKIALQRRTPANSAAHKEIFGNNITFEAPYNSIWIPEHYLGITNQHGHVHRFEFIKAQCDILCKGLSAKKEPIGFLIDTFIENMASGRPDLPSVARKLGMSERTLQRKLREQGTSFWDIYKNTRHELSLRLLTDKNLTISEISRRLGYTSQSAYTRAVKNVYGKTPGQLRNLL